jgi:hypothetical protein
MYGARKFSLDVYTLHKVARMLLAARTRPRDH